jgi:sentrin-specific protease 1
VSGVVSTAESTFRPARISRPRPPKPYAPTIDQLRVTHLAKNKEIDRRLHGPKFPTALPPQDEREVETILKKRGTISKFEREQVNETDISRLRPCQWLNDEIINFYGAMLLARSNSAKENPLVNGASDRHEQKVLNVHYFSTFFWPKLKGEGYEKGRLAKWTKKVNLNVQLLYVVLIFASASVISSQKMQF